MTQQKPRMTLQKPHMTLQKPHTMSAEHAAELATGSDG